MIICITGYFQVYDKRGHPIPGKTEWGVSHGVDADTGRNVCMSFGKPQELGAVWSAAIQEWIIMDKDESEWRVH